MEKVIKTFALFVLLLNLSINTTLWILCYLFILCASYDFAYAFHPGLLRWRLQLFSE